jgi:hypothetical protein
MGCKPAKKKDNGERGKRHRRADEGHGEIVIALK